jgi:hypothetical protein
MRVSIKVNASNPEQFKASVGPSDPFATVALALPSDFPAVSLPFLVESHHKPEVRNFLMGTPNPSSYSPAKTAEVMGKAVIGMVVGNSSMLSGPRELLILADRSVWPSESEIIQAIDGLEFSLEIPE